jgi:hypothetical protein
MMGRRPRRALEATALIDGLKAGTFVSWKSSKGTNSGRVVSVHTKGKVPAVPTEVTGTKEKPAARVRLYAKSGNGYSPTEVHLGFTADKLTTIDELPEPAEEAYPTPGSFDEIRSKVRDAISDRIGSVSGSEPSWCYVVDLGPDWAVYQVGDYSDYWLVSYTTDEAGVIELGDAVEVTPQTTYVPEVDADDTGATEATDRVEGRLLCAKGSGADGGRIFGTRIIAYGDSKNGRRYPEAVMRAAVPMYEGAKAFDHHRTEAELRSSTVVGLVGYFRNVEASSDGIVGDLCLLPSATHTAEALDASLLLQAGGLAPLIGISHDVMGLFRPVVEGGRTLQEATAISAVNSADVVADPAAGGQATRVVAGGLNQGDPVNLKQLLALLRAADPAKRSELLTAHAQILEAAGLSNDDAIRMAEAAEPTPAPTPATEATPPATVYARESIVGRQLVALAVAQAELPDKVTESVAAMLGATFTEADVLDKIEVVKAAREGLEKAGFRPSVPALEGVTEESYEKMVKAIDAMLDPRSTEGYGSLKAAYVDFTGRRGSDLFAADFNRQMFVDSVMAVDARGRESLYSSDLRAVESVSSGTWGTVLGDSITRRMVAEYQQPSLQTWRQIVSSIVPVNDFRTQRIERLGGYGTLPTVAEGAPYQALTSPGNEEVTYSLSKRGGTEDLTMETIANDDLRAVQRIPVKLGLAASQTLFRFVMDFFITNPNVYDSSAYFVAGHNNTTSAALSRTALDAARKGMRKQTAYGDTSDILSLVPRTILVPSTLENLAWTIVNSAVAIPTAAPDGAASNIPNLHQGMDLLVVDYWDATSATAWFLVADPNMAPTLEVGFYQGQQDPALFVQNDPTVGSVFQADKVTWKIRHIYSGAVLDFRSAYRGNS